MVTTIQIEEICQHTWDDSIISAVYESEECKQNDQTTAFNSNASKKDLLRKISALSNISTDATVILDNILELKEIEAIRNTHTLTLTTNTKKVSTYLTKSLFDALCCLK